MKGVPYKLVFVEWEDSFGVSPTWEPIDNADIEEGYVCASIGWLVAENRYRLVVVPHITIPNDTKDAADGCGDMTIPRSAIRRIVVLPAISDGKPQKKHKRRSL